MINKFSSKFSLAGSLPVLVAAVIASSTATSSAIITVTLNGTPGSNVISYEVSGSITALYAGSANSSSFGKILQNRVNAITPDAFWQAGADNDLGDVYKDGSFSDGQNNNLVLSNNITLFKNGVEFGMWDTIVLDPDGSNGSLDDVEFDPSSSVSYPAMAIGDVFSASGSGTFTLEEGNYDTIFNEGVYQGSDAHGAMPYQVIVGVPEPSGFLLLGVGGAFCFFRRRR